MLQDDLKNIRTNKVSIKKYKLYCLPTFMVNKQPHTNEVISIAHFAKVPKADS